MIRAAYRRVTSFAFLLRCGYDVRDAWYLSKRVDG